MRRLIAAYLFTVLALVAAWQCSTQAGWNSRDSNYNIAIASSGGSTVLFDATSSGQNSAGTITGSGTSKGTSGGITYFWTHTPVGTPTAVAVVVQNYDPNGTITGVTYGGTAMVLVGTKETFPGGGSYCYIFGLANPASGAQQIVVSGSSSASGMFTSAQAITVTGSDTTATATGGMRSGSYGSAQGSSTTASVVVATAAGDLAIDLVTDGAGATVTPAAGMTAFWDLNAGAYTNASRQTASSSSTTESYTLSPSDTWGMVAAAFKHG
jgi:hypothetical protein